MLRRIIICHHRGTAALLFAPNFILPNDLPRKVLLSGAFFGKKRVFSREIRINRPGALLQKGVDLI